MAGAGYKLFNTGDVLTAAQVNTYLNEQTVMVFASSAARTSALSGVLAEGMVSYLQDTNAVEVYNGSAWVGVSGAGDITEVQAGTGISVASGTGPIPVITNTATTTIDAEGDLLVGDAADALQRLAIGSNGNVLTVDTAVDGKIKWAAPAAAASGLTLISATSFSSVSSVSLNSVFTATYANYRVQINYDGASVSDFASLRLRASGSDDTASNYLFTGIRNYGDIDTISTRRSTNATSFNQLAGLPSSGQTGGQGSTVEFKNPQKSLRTQVDFRSIGTDDATRIVVDQSMGIFNNSTAFDGFTILMNSGNFSGKVYVYGYQES
jgi:hypothetical protein